MSSAIVLIHRNGAYLSKEFTQGAVMSISTRLTQILQIAHPILLAPMDIVSDGRLASAVSQAGGFGIIGGEYGDELRLEREMDTARNSRVGVGFITWSMAKRPKLLRHGARTSSPCNNVVFW